MSSLAAAHFRHLPISNVNARHARPSSSSSQPRGPLLLRKGGVGAAFQIRNATSSAARTLARQRLPPPTATAAAYTTAAATHRLRPFSAGEATLTLVGSRRRRKDPKLRLGTIVAAAKGQRADSSESEFIPPTTREVTAPDVLNLAPEASLDMEKSSVGGGIDDGRLAGGHETLEDMLKVGMGLIFFGGNFFWFLWFLVLTFGFMSPAFFIPLPPPSPPLHPPQPPSLNNYSVVTPGCQVGYIEHTGCHQFECVPTCKIKW
jgi:hypothetical protein